MTVSYWLNKVNLSNLRVTTTMNENERKSGYAAKIETFIGIAFCNAF